MPKLCHSQPETKMQNRTRRQRPRGEGGLTAKKISVRGGSRFLRKEHFHRRRLHVDLVHFFLAVRSSVATPRRKR
jgi:hypothetical protein